MHHRRRQPEPPGAGMRWRKTLSFVTVLVALLGVELVAFAKPPRHPSLSEKSPKQLYEAACSSCHGPRGKGRAQTIVGFDIPLPDFTDCSFATREPDADWSAVVHDGGPVRGFDEMMPAFGDALTMEEIEKAVEHVRTFCAKDAWPRGELNMPRPMSTEKAYPEDELVFTTGVAAEGNGAVVNEILYEKRFGARNQLEVTLPFAFREHGTGGWNGGIGDIAVGAKRVMFQNLSSGTIFSVNGEVILPTGKEEGLGRGVTVFEPFVTFGQSLPADSFVHFQGGFEIPTDSGKVENEAFWRFALGKSFVQGRWGRAWSPIVELLASRDLEAGAETHWDLLPQVQVTLNTRQHVMANIGVRFPLNGSEFRDTTIFVYLLWEWFDGGFLEGW